MVGWAIAALALLLGWRIYGGSGVVMVLSVLVFWLLLQYSQAMRVMRAAGRSPVGHVDSAVMLNAKLRRGMTMLRLLALTRSLGRRTDAEEECYEWSDPGGSVVSVRVENGRCVSWQLHRPAETA